MKINIKLTLIAILTLFLVSCGGGGDGGGGGANTLENGKVTVRVLDAEGVTANGEYEVYANIEYKVRVDVDSPPHSLYKIRGWSQTPGSCDISTLHDQFMLKLKGASSCTQELDFSMDMTPLNKFPIKFVEKPTNDLIVKIEKKYIVKQNTKGTYLYNNLTDANKPTVTGEKCEVLGSALPWVRSNSTTSDVIPCVVNVNGTLNGAPVSKSVTVLAIKKSDTATINMPSVINAYQAETISMEGVTLTGTLTYDWHTEYGCGFIDGTGKTVRYKPYIGKYNCVITATATNGTDYEITEKVFNVN